MLFGCADQSPPDKTMNNVWEINYNAGFRYTDYSNKSPIFQGNYVVFKNLEGRVKAVNDQVEVIAPVGTEVLGY